MDRTGLYFVPLTLLCATALTRISQTPRPAFSRIATAVCGLFAIQFAAQSQVKSFHVWRYDADTEHLFSLIEQRRPASGPVRLGVSWVLEPALNFYRVTRGATWLEPVQRDGLEGDRQFYVITGSEPGEIARLGLREICRGKLSGTTLASPAAR